MGALIGWYIPALVPVRPLGLLLGAGIGLVFAALVCGTLAYFALMERHMRSIAETLRAGSDKVLPARGNGEAGRQEPRL